MLVRVFTAAAAFTTIAFGAMAQEAETAAPAAAVSEPAAPVEAAAVAEPAPAATAAPASERRICKTQAQTGSRLGGRRICRTRTEWEAQGESGRRFLRDIQNGPTMQCGQSAIGCGG